MRLWHQAIIPYLPRPQLLGQNRECCALRGLGWGKKHSTVNYVFNEPYVNLFSYHMLIHFEMENRGYHPGQLWKNPRYRGKRIPLSNWVPENIPHFSKSIYEEHNDAYLSECLQLLSIRMKQKSYLYSPKEWDILKGYSSTLFNRGRIKINYFL